MAISEVKIREITTNVESRRTALNHEVLTTLLHQWGLRHREKKPRSEHFSRSKSWFFRSCTPHLQSINLSLKHTNTNYSNSSAVSKAKKMNDSHPNSPKNGGFSDFWPT